MDVWEFDAPQFVDFTQPQVDNEYDDTWFDTHTEDDDFLRLSKEGGACSRLENGKVEVVDTGCRSPRYLNVKPVRVLAGEKHASQNSVKTDCPSPSKRQKKSTDVLTVGSSSSPAANTISSDHAETKSSNDDIPAMITRLRTPNKEVESQSPNALRQNKNSKSPKKNLKVSESPKMKATCAKTGSCRELERCHNSSNSSNVTGEKPSAKPVTLTRSQSLNCRISKTSALCAKSNMHESENQTLSSNGNEKLLESDLNSNNVGKCKTTEELELEKIAKMKREMVRTRKMAQESYKKAMSAQGYMPVRSAQPATTVVGFNFKTDERVKNPDAHKQEHKVKDFTKSLREPLLPQTLPSKPQVRGATCPQPFKLTTAKSTSSLTQQDKYESVAERVVAFHRTTPARFKSQPRVGKERARSANKSDSSSNGGRMRSQSPKLTVAKTPTLITRGRHRPVHALSQEQKEQMEFEEHQKLQFKAQPVNHKVFEAPVIPKVPPKPVTTVEEFNLQYKKLLSITDLQDSDMDDTYEFHANPVNHKILAGPVGIKPVEPRPITIAESPAFALKNRIRIPVELPKKEEEKVPAKVGQVPYSGVPFRPLLTHQHTIPEPFSVVERSKAMLTRRDCKIQQYLEEERKAHEFYAQDLPSDSPDQLPPKQPKPRTQPEPFHLEVDDRGEKYQKELKAKLEEEERIAREIANFKAGPNSVIHKEPFQALKSCRPLTERINFSLNTDVRATQREQFDQHLKAKEAEMEALKKKREERKEREEKTAVARMRLMAVHKASGVRRYKSVNVKPSDKPVTQPQSPRFSQRTRTKHNNSEDMN